MVSTDRQQTVSTLGRCGKFQVTNITQHKVEGSAQSWHWEKQEHAALFLSEHSFHLFQPLFSFSSFPFPLPLPLFGSSLYPLSRHPPPAASSCLAEHLVSHCHASNAQVKPSDIYLPQSEGKKKQPTASLENPLKKIKIGKQWLIRFLPQRLSSFQTPLWATPATCPSNVDFWVPSLRKSTWQLIHEQEITSGWSLSQCSSMCFSSLHTFRSLCFISGKWIKQQMVNET